MRHALAKGVQRLLAMQTSDGGLGFWPGAEDADLWGSAYGGMALEMAHQLGVEVPELARRQLGDFLSGQLRGLNAEPDETAMATLGLALHTLALAGRAEPAYHEKLFERRARLPQEARHLLASAIHRGGSNDSKMVQTLLVEAPSEDCQTRYWFPKSYQQALALLAWSECAPKSPQTETLLQGLLDARDPSSGHWRATYTNAWALRALTSYLKAKEASPLTGSVAARLGEEERQVTLSSQTPGQTLSFPWPAKTAPPVLQVVPEGRGQIHVELSLATRGDTMPEPVHGRGFRVERRYERRLPDGGFEALTDSPSVGDLIRVCLNVANDRPTRYVVVDDPLPATLEAVNLALDTQRVAGANEENVSNHWITDFLELRDDRALFFCDDLEGTGTFELRYWARVTSAGQVLAPPTKVEAMYDPSRFALGVAEPFRSRSMTESVNE